MISPLIVLLGSPLPTWYAGVELSTKKRVYEWENDEEEEEEDLETILELRQVFSEMAGALLPACLFSL